MPTLIQSAAAQDGRQRKIPATGPAQADLAGPVPARLVQQRDLSLFQHARSVQQRDLSLFQRHPALTAEQMREFCWRSGQPIDVDGLREQIKELRRRSNADLGGHALIASMKFFARNTPSRKDRVGGEPLVPK
ncbi:hypothetical protein SH139x_005630 [Planctomycetaceae bacterium SH139]